MQGQVFVIEIMITRKTLTRGRTDHFAVDGYLFTVSNAGLIFFHVAGIGFRNSTFSRKRNIFSFCVIECLLRRSNLRTGSRVILFESYRANIHTQMTYCTTRTTKVAGRMLSPFTVRVDAEAKTLKNSRRRQACGALS